MGTRLLLRRAGRQRRGWVQQRQRSASGGAAGWSDHKRASNATTRGVGGGARGNGACGNGGWRLDLCAAVGRGAAVASGLERAWRPAQAEPRAGDAREPMTGAGGVREPAMSREPRADGARELAAAWGRRRAGAGGRSGWTMRRAGRVAEPGQESTTGGSGWLATVAAGAGGGGGSRGEKEIRV
ncbi:WAG22 antigen-like [Panicum virgatum]|uniref:WAG22 antigen-like n=1 Tax=Panicum virgatum TaxID=38727 RepID=UPI0019D525DA|nr:WAG22 antigen-like [Panicum virgatum]